MGIQIQLALNVVFGTLELAFDFSAGAVAALLCLRLAIVASLAVFYWVTVDTRFHQVMDELALGIYTVRSRACSLTPFSLSRSKGVLGLGRAGWVSIRTRQDSRARGGAAVG